MPPSCILPCSHLRGNDKGRTCIKHYSQVLRHILWQHHVHKMDVKVTQPHQDQPAGPAPHSSISDTACGSQPSLTENGTVNTNVFKMADSVQK